MNFLREGGKSREIVLGIGRKGGICRASSRRLSLKPRSELLALCLCLCTDSGGQRCDAAWLCSQRYPFLMPLPCFSVQSRSLQEGTEDSPRFQDRSRDSGLPGGLREERGGWQSQVCLRSLKGGQVAAGGSRVSLCGGQLPVCVGHRSSGNRDRGAPRLPASAGSRAAGDQPCCAQKCAGAHGPQGHVDAGNDHQWHQVSQSWEGRRGGGGKGSPALQIWSGLHFTHLSKDHKGCPCLATTERKAFSQNSS